MAGARREMELCLDSSTRYASVGLSTHGELTSQLAWRSEQNHSVELVPALRLLMERSNVGTEDVEAIFVAKGPGGFSALRVGISVAKALAAAAEVPLVGVNTLDVEAQPYLGLGLPVCAIIEAGRDKVYASMYSREGHEDGASGATYAVETHEGLVAGVSEDTLFCGEAVAALRGMLKEKLGGRALVADTSPPTRRPSDLARLGYRRLKASDTDDPATLQPLYMCGGQVDAAKRRAATK